MIHNYHALVNDAEAVIKGSTDLGYVQVMVERLDRAIDVIHEAEREGLKLNRYGYSYHPNVQNADTGSGNPLPWKEFLPRLRSLKADAQSRMFWLRGREPIPAGKAAELQARLAEVMKENASLEQDNQQLKSENQQLEVKAALLDERCKQYEKTTQHTLDETKRLRAEVMDGNANLKQHNQKLKTENQQLEVKVAVLGERSQQDKETIQHQVDENKSMRGELSDMRDRVMLFARDPLRVGLNNSCETLACINIGSDVSGDGDACDVSSASWCVCMSADGDSASVSSLGSSWISIRSAGAHCFLANAIFKTKVAQSEFFLPGSSLMKGSQVVADDNQTVLEVTCTPEQHETDWIIELRTGDAALPVTGDHRVPVIRGESDEPVDVQAKDLQSGDRIFVNGVPTELMSAEAKELPGTVPTLKVTFKPDKPVAVFMAPAAISTKGHQKKALRRSGMNRRQRQNFIAAAACSIPDTEGIYQD